MRCLFVPIESKPLLFVLLTLVFSISSQTIYSQEFEPGYVVLKTCDTLFGVVNNIKDGRLLDKIRFKNERGKTKRYTAEDLLSYKAGIDVYESLWFKEDIKFFEFNYYSKPGFGEKVFLRVLSKGPLNCYGKQVILDENDLVSEFELFLKESDKTMVRATQGLFGLKKKRLAEFFQDCPSLVEKINSREITKPMQVVTYFNQYCQEVKK